MVYCVSDVDDNGETAGLDYQLCEFKGTRLRFRGPAPDLSAPFVAVLGGTETYGKYVEHPFPALLQDWLETPVANFGVQQAGLTLFSEERWLLDTASRAEVTVLQVLGAQNMSNRLYSVHSRRNDRFLGVSPALRDMYPDVDFAEVNFTGHLLDTLATGQRGVFAALVDELKWAWVQRMRRIVQAIDGKVILLWVSDRCPDETRNRPQECEPHFVDRAMLDELSADVADVVEIVRPAPASLEGMVFTEGEAEAAENLPGPADHARIAEALAISIARLRGDPDAACRARASG